MARELSSEPICQIGMTCGTVLVWVTCLAGMAAMTSSASVAGSPHLVITQPPGTLRFKVELQNSGPTPLILNVGMMLANGRELYPDRIRLQLAGPDKKVLHLQMILPTGIAGRSDAMVVPLPSGASYSLQFGLDGYIAPNESVWRLDLHPGSYSIVAEYTGVAVPMRSANLDMQGISLFPYWTGTVRSDVLNFEVPR